MTRPSSGMLPASAPPASDSLASTGVPGLDAVLGGGLQRGSLVIAAGPPGSGKTILAHQIAFSAARAGRHTVVLTAFSEPTNKLIAHMRPFAFFDQDLLGQTLDVFSVQQSLRQGLATAADEIVGVVRAAKADLVVLDGFRGVRETAEHPEEARRFIYAVSNRLSLLSITLLLTSEAHVRDIAFFPEATTADVLLGLTFEIIEARERRTLEVLKVRGTAPLAGQHALVIGDGGVAVYPRLEARMARLTDASRPLATSQAPAARTRHAPRSAPLTDRHTAETEREGADERVSTGIPGLDTLLAGGLVRGSSTLVAGERGAGKTLMGLQFALQHAHTDQPSLFVSFRDTTQRLLRIAAPFQWAAPLKRALEARTLVVLRTPPIELRADVLAGSLLVLLDETGARRLVLDEIGEIAHAFAAEGHPHRFHDYMAALIETLRLHGVTSLLTQQAAAGRRSALEYRLGPAATLTENLLWLRARSDDAHSGRSLEILQPALANRSDAWHPVTIQAPEGLAVLVEASGHQTRARRRERMAGDSGEIGIHSAESLPLHDPDAEGV